MRIGLGLGLGAGLGLGSGEGLGSGSGSVVRVKVGTTLGRACGEPRPLGRLHARRARRRLGLTASPAHRVLLMKVPPEGVGERLEAECLQRPEHVALVDLAAALAPHLDARLAGDEGEELGAARLDRLDRVALDPLGLRRTGWRIAVAPVAAGGVGRGTGGEMGGGGAPGQPGRGS